MTSPVEKSSSAMNLCRAFAAAAYVSMGLAVFSPHGAAEAAKSPNLGNPETATPAADNGAVAVMYQRFGETGFPATNITLEQFEAHIAELTSGAYKVLPLADVVAALREGRSLPDRSVVLTIDDAYLSVYREAWPRLRAANLPFTVFVSTDVVDRSYPDFMSWEQLRELAVDPNVTIGLHGSKHGHMIEATADTNRAKIKQSGQRLRDKLGFAATLFAYPYGEYSTELVEVVREAGFEAAMGQQSGAIGRTEDLFTLPRFPLSELYGGPDRFRLTVNSLPLPVTDVTPGDLLLTSSTNPPAYGFTVTSEVRSLNGLQCYTGNHEVVVEQLGLDRVEVRIDSPLQPGRRRINCTLPGPDRRWRWLGKQFYIPRS
ncbi:polysaccharide deacetylase family protein [Pelagibius sp. Alg239-R121]|uniref:polysaccharide deacetylase family protein n=1 Tax=Pelagibius sp. Alg239-R121 TaxID=2993448 RepID=UPI0024A74072|nr:polysaccharide deacetylase family protein [Pelagibius sp. Alg239-R121]